MPHGEGQIRVGPGSGELSGCWRISMRFKNIRRLEALYHPSAAKRGGIQSSLAKPMLWSVECREAMA